jgi:hypothetical protein
MKAVTETLGVARSNVVERVKAARLKRGPQTRDGDLELGAEIRALVDSDRPTAIAGSPRSSSASGDPAATPPSMPSVSTAL